MRGLLTAALVMSVLFTSCSEKGDVAVTDGNLYLRVPSEVPPARSSITCSESEVTSVCIAVYSEETGVLVEKKKFDGSSGHFSLYVGRRYYLAAVFNMGEVSFPDRWSDIGTMSLGWPGLGAINANGLPLAWSGSVKLTSDGQSVEMKAVPLVSKISLRIDAGGMDGEYEVSSVTLKGAASSVKPFSSSSVAAETLPGWSDRSSPSDVAVLNAGGEVSFYAFENCQGTALPGNTDPWAKVPDNIPGKSSVCTYLEVEGTYSNHGLVQEGAGYRMYLGEDAVSNFDLVRNRHYSVILSLSDDGTLRSSWRVIPGTLSDTRTLSFSPGTLSVMMNSSSEPFRVVSSPSGVQYSISGGKGFDEAGLTCVSTGTSDEYRIVSGRTLTADAYVSLAVTSWDGRIIATLPVTVKARYPVRLKVSSPGYQSGTETEPVWKIDWAEAGSSNPSYTITVVYNDGSEASAVGGVPVERLCTVTQKYEAGNAGAGRCFVFDRGSIRQAEGGNANTGGNGTVTFTYEEAGTSVGITVRWWKRYVTRLHIIGISSDNRIADTRMIYGCTSVKHGLSGISTVYALYNVPDLGTPLGYEYADVTSIMRSRVRHVTSSDPSILKVEDTYGYSGFKCMRKGDVTVTGLASESYRDAVVSMTMHMYPKNRISLSRSSFNPVIASSVTASTYQNYYLWSEDSDGRVLDEGNGKIVLVNSWEYSEYDSGVSTHEIWGDLHDEEPVTYHMYAAPLWAAGHYEDILESKDITFY